MGDNAINEHAWLHRRPNLQVGQSCLLLTSETNKTDTENVIFSYKSIHECSGSMMMGYGHEDENISNELWEDLGFNRRL
jgi:hypothetical protein